MKDRILANKGKKSSHEPKLISGGLDGVRDRFMKLGRSYEQHLAMKRSKVKNQQ